MRIITNCRDRGNACEREAGTYNGDALHVEWSTDRSTISAIEPPQKDTHGCSVLRLVVVDLTAYLKAVTAASIVPKWHVDHEPACHKASHDPHQIFNVIVAVWSPMP